MVSEWVVLFVSLSLLLEASYPIACIQVSNPPNPL